MKSKLTPTPPHSRMYQKYGVKDTPTHWMIQLGRKCFRQTQTKTKWKSTQQKQTVQSNYYVCYLLIKLFCLEKDTIDGCVLTRANDSNSSFVLDQLIYMDGMGVMRPEIFSVIANLLLRKHSNDPLITINYWIDFK